MEFTMRSFVVRSIVFAALLFPAGLVAQSFPTDNPILKAIWDEGMSQSQVYDLAQTLNDSLGPRLTGTLARIMKLEGAKYCLASLCGGGGQGGAVLMESM